MSAEKILDEYTSLVEAELEKFFARKKVLARDYDARIEQLYEDLRNYVLRKGKRLMSASVLLTYEGYTGEIDEKALTACVAIELYRHGILVHDDLVDEDVERRGGKTFQRVYDEKIALFAGNILNALAFEALYDLDPQALSSLVRDYLYVNESQVLDYLFEKDVPLLSEWESMASKRAPSVFRATLLTGAILAKAPGGEIKLLEEAATHIGFAFDIQDDLIGLYNQENNDVDREKKPLHIVYAYQLMGDGFDTIFKSRDVGAIKAAVRDSGALEATKRASREHAIKAISLIERTSMNDKTKKFYSDFINFIIESLDWYK
ncbi:MAG: polyprenyl synthetase family protein [Candidatus Altiarchaeota archaeon]|nr:polyprenyl synthetase family protein [Candidatus Altiarchaeota archaeon]